MSWSYRLVQDGYDPDEPYVLAEFYDDGAAAGGWTEAFAPRAETPERVREILAQMMAALDQPVVVHARPGLYASVAQQVREPRS